MLETAIGSASQRTGAFVNSSSPLVVAFVCENSGRPGRKPSSGLRPRPTSLDFAWPYPVREIAIPCAGRLQPEHILKAFEEGADVVGVVACDEDNCHHQEGGKRCRRRMDYVASLLGEIGLGADRVLLVNLPGSAKEDMALGAGLSVSPLDPTLRAKITVARDAFIARADQVKPNALHRARLSEESPYDVENEDDSNE